MRRSGNECARVRRSSSVVQLFSRSFSIDDGAMQLTRTPSGATSLARWRVKATTPALAAAYAAFERAAWRAAADDIVTIDPWCLSIITGRNAVAVRKAEVRS